MTWDSARAVKHRLKDKNKRLPPPLTVSLKKNNILLVPSLKCWTFCILGVIINDAYVYSVRVLCRCWASVFQIVRGSLTIFGRTVYIQRKKTWMINSSVSKKLSFSWIRIPDCDFCILRGKKYSYICFYCLMLEVKKTTFPNSGFKIQYLALSRKYASLLRVC